MPSITLNSEEHGLALLAALLGAPIKQALLNTSPNRLRMMQFLEAPRYMTDNRPESLGDWMRCSTRLHNLLENSYPSDSSLVEAIRAPDEDWISSEDHSKSNLAVRALLPPLVSDCYLRNQLEQPLTGEHVASLINWTCGWSLSADQFATPIKTTAVGTIRENIKQKAIECGLKERQFTFEELRMAIY